MKRHIKDFFHQEAASGIVLMVFAVLAMIAANSPLASHYETWRASSQFVINDGLMAIFFLLVGLEIKREITDGELSSFSRAILPLGAALGGVVMPAIIYLGFNAGGDAIRGWAIPAATDIAFSLGVLALFGDRISKGLRVFLLSVAVIDDLVAVIIIAVFYTGQLFLPALAVAAGCGITLWLLARRNIDRFWPYGLIGIVLWAAILKSGVHPTIAGVTLGLLMPLPLAKRTFDKLQPWVAFFIMPLFAFANAGVSLAGISFNAFLMPVPLGIILGLFAGKQLGIFAASWGMVRLKVAQFPAHTTWAQFHAVCVLAGIGFTMSLFIGSLAFSDSLLMLYARVGVITGSLLSTLFGAMFLLLALRKNTV